MLIFTIIQTLESTSGFTVSAHVTNNEMLVTFKNGNRKLKKTFTDEEVNKSDINYWSAIGGNVKLKLKSER